jgi:hypothetical protein
MTYSDSAKRSDGLGSPSSAGEWWRWPLVLPAAFIGGAIGATILTLIQWFGMRMQGGYREDGWYYLYILPLISSAAFGWLFSLIAFHVAPRGKTLTGAVLVTLLGVICVASVVLAWGPLNYPTSQAVQSTLAAIATLAGAVVGLIQASSDA